MSDAPYPFNGDETLRGPIEEALHRVVDPEMAVDIVDLGLVYGVGATHSTVQVRLTMTSAACPVAEMIIEDIVRELEKTLGGGVGIDVALVWEPPWTPERMNPRVRALMGWD